MKSSDRVVVVSTANGLKFTDFKVRYHEGTLPDVPAPEVREPPRLLPTTTSPSATTSGAGWTEDRRRSWKTA